MLAWSFRLTLLVSVLLLAPMSSAVSQEGVGLVLAQLVASKEYDRARALLSAQPGEQDENWINHAQLEGLIAADQGEFETSAAIFRTILVRHPGFVPARLELARVLARMGARAAARHHYEALLAVPVPEIAQLARSAITRLEGDEGGFGGSAYVSLTPSTNINKGSGHDTYQLGPYSLAIDDGSKQAPGFGLAVGGAGHYVARLDADNTLTASIQGDILTRPSGPGVEQLALKSMLIWSRRLGDAHISLGPQIEQRWQGFSPFVLRYGITGQVRKPLDQNTIVGLSFAALGQDFAEQDHRDGYRVTSQITLDHILDPTLRFTFTGGVDIERTQRAHLDHNDFRFGVALRQEWTGGLISTVKLEAALHTYLGNYPGLGAPRSDTRLSAGLVLSHRGFDIAGFTPEVSYQYARQFSNVSFFDHDSHDIGLTLTRNF